MQTKLVNCGDSIIVYDYMGKRMIDKSVFSRDYIDISLIQTETYT